MKIEMPIIKTKQFTLRDVKEDDYLDYFFIGSSYENTKYLTWGPFVDIRQAKLMLERFYLSGRSKDVPKAYAIEWNKTKEMIGLIEFHTYTSETNCAEVGFILREDYHHKGIMRACFKHLIEQGFNYLNLSKILVGHVDINESSMKLIKHFDFKYEYTKYFSFLTKDTSERRNIIYYSLYKEEYERRNNDDY